MPQPALTALEMTAARARHAEPLRRNADGILRRQLERLTENPLLLVVGTLIALAWANVDLHSYERLAHALHFAVNDVGMVFFFALAAKEVVEATVPGGALHSARRAAMPVLAATGGMIGPAAIFLALVRLTAANDLTRGWAIPCATDIASATW
jgi:NhaA family Na+:H+ antiporter